MRYFKYKGLQTTEKETQKALLAEFTKEEKRLIRKDKNLPESRKHERASAHHRRDNIRRTP